MKRLAPIPFAAALLLAAAPLFSTAQDSKDAVDKEAKKDASGHMTAASRDPASCAACLECVCDVIER